MNLRQAAQQALEALENSLYPQQKQLQAITALRAALAEPEQEPVFDCPRCGHCCPQRLPLTDEEIEQAYRHIWSNIPADFDHTSMGWIEQGIRYAEQANGIKGTS